MLVAVEVGRICTPGQHTPEIPMSSWTWNLWPEKTANRSTKKLLRDCPGTIKERSRPTNVSFWFLDCSLREKPHEALLYITPLLDFALEHIPFEKVKETPLYILATAGMRMLSSSQQEDILKHLREGILQKYQFLFPEGNLEIISGKQEGIYQWLAINYVLGKFRHSETPQVISPVRENEDDNLILRPRTVGAIDMGGASMQIAMEITSTLQLEGLSVSLGKGLIVLFVIAFIISFQTLKREQVTNIYLDIRNPLQCNFLVKVVIGNTEMALDQNRKSGPKEGLNETKTN